MIRNVDLVSYLPPYLKDYGKEMVAALEAEDPEFTLAWEEADRALCNEFIMTADEYGISRFEDLLGITPANDDTLESRRSRVLARWFGQLPYTLRMLVEMLTSLCGGLNFTITKDFLNYRIAIETNLELSGQVDELEKIIERVMPCNMVVDLRNEVHCDAELSLKWGGVISSTEIITIQCEEGG